MNNKETPLNGDLEGVVKYTNNHRQQRLPPKFIIKSDLLIVWRHIFWQLGLIGNDPHRYGGAGFGNLSARVEHGFIISGTQTALQYPIDHTGFAWVERLDIAANQLWSKGETKPSSEALTHGQIYALDDAIKFVFHLHAPAMWTQRQTLSIPTTDDKIPYGTPQMATEVKRLFLPPSVLMEVPTGPAETIDKSVNRSDGIIAMGGHEDGIIGFGARAEDTGASLVKLHAKALQLLSTPT